MTTEQKIWYLLSVGFICSIGAVIFTITLVIGDRVSPVPITMFSIIPGCASLVFFVLANREMNNEKPISTEVKS